jgi:hypothetical protein
MAVSVASNQQTVQAVQIKQKAESTQKSAATVITGATSSADLSNSASVRANIQSTNETATLISSASVQAAASDSNALGFDADVANLMAGIANDQSGEVAMAANGDDKTKDVDVSKLNTADKATLDAAITANKAGDVKGLKVDGGQVTLVADAAGKLQP